SVIAGYVNLPGALGGSSRLEHFLAPSFSVGEAQGGPSIQAASEAGGPASHDDDSVEIQLMGASTVVALRGIAVAAYVFLKNQRAADRVAERFAGIYRVLANKYYVDEIYDATIVQPIRIVSEEGLWKGIDVGLIDGVVNGVGRAVRGTSEVLRRLQTGSVRAYAASLFLGVVLILGYYLWR